jgi:hypothetical protein
VPPFPEHFRDGMFGAGLGAFIADEQNLCRVSPNGLSLRPTGQGFGVGVHEGNTALRIGGQHRVAETAECRAQPLLACP